MDTFPSHHAYLIPLLPLTGALVAGFGGRWLKQKAHWAIWLGVGASAVLSVWLAVGMLGDGVKPGTEIDHWSKDFHHWFTWITAGRFRAEAGTYLDPLTAVMLCVVTCVGFIITVFSRGYMADDKGYGRFFAYLGLFIFAMTCLVMGNNFLMLYLGWEGVGLCSYLLIGHYYDRPSARDAAKKAFIVNRVGDFGFALGIMLIFLTFGTISYFGGKGAAPGVLELATMPLDKLALVQGVNVAWVPTALRWVPFLLMLGAFGKSAQFPLYVWLPDAMEGPTPVSALIHAATMVTAGIYMIVRCQALFMGNQAALTMVAVVGAFTALFAATIALRQFDLKKVFAYSTISQLGFMFVGVAVLAPVAGVFHLVTHAFFKALLFLSSGVVMHAMFGKLDMRQMSGLRRVLPWTNLLMLVGCLALAGVPPFAGFFSKDEIIHAAFMRNPWLGAVMLFTAFLTAYYTFRLYFRVFWGPEVMPQAEEHGRAAHATTDHGQAAHATADGRDPHGTEDHGRAAHATTGHGAAHKREPAIMIAPLVLLAIGALVAGLVNWPPRHRDMGDFLGDSPSFVQGFDMAKADEEARQQRMAKLGKLYIAHEVDPSGFGQAKDQPEPWFNSMMGISVIVSACGIGLAYLLHCKDRRADERLAAQLQPMTGILEAKYWVDEIYDAAIVAPLRRMGEVCFAIDRLLIDGLVWAISFAPQTAGFTLKISTQRTGSLQGYALAMLLGIVIILVAVLW